MAKMMSPEKAKAFDKVMKSTIDALAVFEKTGKREQFVATQDQIDAFKKEFNAKLEIKFEDDKIF